MAVEESLATRAKTAAERLDGLRAALQAGGLDGFLVPMADEHLGEYIPASAKRLAWLTGFTGSAGLAIVLAERAALFVDGRYTTQAPREVEGTLYQFRHLTDEPPATWLKETVKPDQAIGYDPWLHAPDGLKPIRQAIEKRGAKLVAVEANPIDGLWTDRPLPPRKPIVAHPLDFAGEAQAAKRKRIGAELAKQGLTAAVLAAADSVAWLFNLRGADVPNAPLPLAYALIAADGRARLFADPEQISPATREHLGPEVAIEPRDALGAALDRLGKERATVRIDTAATPSWIAQRLEAAGATLDAGADPCAKPKAIKNATEIAGIKAAHRRDGLALAQFLATLAPGVDETEAARRLDGLRAGQERFMGTSFPTISAFGPNGAIVHYHARPGAESRLKAGGLYLVDSGGQYLDGTTDVTRTVFLEPGRPDSLAVGAFTRVLKGHIALASAVFPKGTAGIQLDALARRPLWEAGLDYDHGTGHGVGCYLSVHEGPQRIAKTGSSVALEPGMVVSIEPGYYKPGAFGIRIENLALVVARPRPPQGERDLLGFEILTLAPIDRALIEIGLLNPRERAWLDAYHRRVFEELAPALGGADAAWLARATQPLSRR